MATTTATRTTAASRTPKFYACSKCGKMTPSADVKVDTEGHYVCPQCAGQGHGNLTFSEVKQTYAPKKTKRKYTRKAEKMTTATAAKKERTMEQQDAEIRAHATCEQLKLRGINAVPGENGEYTVYAGQHTLVFRNEDKNVDKVIGEYCYGNNIADLRTLTRFCKERAEECTAKVDLAKVEGFGLQDHKGRDVADEFKTGPDGTALCDGWRVSSVEMFPDGFVRFYIAGKGGDICVRELFAKRMAWVENGVRHEVFANTGVKLSGDAEGRQDCAEHPRVEVRTLSPDALPDDMPEELKALIRRATAERR